MDWKFISETLIYTGLTHVLWAEWRARGWEELIPVQFRLEREWEWNRLEGMSVGYSYGAKLLCVRVFVWPMARVFTWTPLMDRPAVSSRSGALFTMEKHTMTRCRYNRGYMLDSVFRLGNQTRKDAPAQFLILIKIWISESQIERFPFYILIRKKFTTKHMYK